ncbi:DNA metabolism protein [Enterobacter asburiae]|nr:DNA metabolism protein [Enterobacter cloacae complex sp.]TYG16174.1 DNA metabolism protein [Enterobacter asburiae]
MNPGSARNPHVLRVRSGFCALSESKLAATITPSRVKAFCGGAVCANCSG